MIEMKRKITSLEEGKKEFIVDCKVRNLANDTIEYYEKAFCYFNNFINEEYLCEYKEDYEKDDEKREIDISKYIGQETINQYILYMRNKNLKISTINIRLRGIRSILYYFMKKGYIEQFEIKQAKEDERIPELYTDEEIEILIKKPNLKTCSFAEYRSWVVVNFFIGTGVRSRTLRNIKIKHLDLENDLIYLTTTKGRKMIVIPMSKTLKKILMEYLRIRGGEPEDYLFCNLEGKQLTINALNNIIAKYNRSRGVKKTGIHLFRHYFAKSYIQNGGNALKLQKLLGHSTLEQTKRYVDLFGQDLQQDFDNFSPLDNLCVSNERIKMRAS